MPRDGSGVYSLPVGYLGVAGQVIQPSQHNPPLEDIEDALTDSISRTGVTAITADIPFAGFKLTGLGDATNATDAVNLQTGDARYVTTAPGMSNGTLVQSRTGNAETFALKTLAGTDPSASNPVYFVFQDGAGALVRRTVSAALSVTISSGSTMGAVNSTPFRLWVVAADDGGTVRLGVVKTVSGTNVMPLVGWAAYSSTAEGGAGGADTAQVIYSGTAFTSKYICLVGFGDWDSGLSAVGTWNTAQTRTVTFGTGVPSPGDVVQHRHTSLPTTFGSSTTAVYTDITGLTAAITPRSGANLVRATPRVQGAGDIGGPAIAFGLFRGATNVGGGTASSSRVSAFGGWLRISDNNSCQTATAVIYDAPGSTSAQTYQIKFILQAGGQMIVNATASDSDVAGVGRYSSSLTLEEIMA